MEAVANRVPALDGVRGLAVLAVLVGHGLGHAWTIGDRLSYLGVTVFFVLSGYLITGRLLAGQKLTRFYANRARRLLPAMLTMLAVTGPLFVWLGTPVWYLIEAGTYVRNITASHFGSGLSPWRHMWSLATEEQFYLLWPLVFLLWPGRRVLIVTVAGLLSIFVMDWALATGVGWAWNSPVSTAWSLCLGCALALRGWSPTWPGWLSWSVLRWFGVRSYGMYLWHFPLMMLLALSTVPDDLGRWLGVAAGVGAAVVSWRLVELPWLSRGPGGSVVGHDETPRHPKVTGRSGVPLSSEDQSRVVRDDALPHTDAWLGGPSAASRP